MTDQPTSPPPADVATRLARLEVPEPVDAESLRRAADAYESIAAELTEALRKAQG